MCSVGTLIVLKLILMHNINVVHQEGNIDESIISTCMGLSGISKDNIKARKDLVELCNCPILEFIKSVGKPCASFYLTAKQRK
jgi:hypothetical protein